MSNWFNVSLFPWSKYNNIECQPVSWLTSIFLNKQFVKKVIFLQVDALNRSFYIKFLCFQMSNWLNVSLFPWSRCNNKECQPVSWPTYIFLEEQFVKKVIFLQVDALNNALLSILSFSASKFRTISCCSILIDCVISCS